MLCVCSYISPKHVSNIKMKHIVQKCGNCKMTELSPNVVDQALLQFEEVFEC